MRGTVLDSAVELDPTASVEAFAQMFEEEMSKPRQVPELPSPDARKPRPGWKPPAQVPANRRRQRAV